MKKQILLLVGLLGISPALWAHGGEHYGFWTTLWHVLSQPDHLLGIIVGSVFTLVLIVAVFRIKRRLKQTKKIASSLQ